MFKIRFDGWKQGLNKVKLIKLIREDAGIPLGKALGVVDQLLDGEKPVVTLEVRRKADHLVKESRRLGARAELVE